MRGAVVLASLLAIAWAHARWGAAGIAAAVAVVVAVVFGGWRLLLLIYPNGRCWWCKGTGRFWGSKSNRWGPCWFCKGKPRRRRGARKG